MQQQYRESQNYVYRRIPPYQFKVKGNLVSPSAFTIKTGELGLSVFRCDISSPYHVLQDCIDERKRRLSNSDDSECEKATIWLAKNPDVETLVNKQGWRIVIIPIDAVLSLGFVELDGPELNGHINIIGTVEQFEIQAPDFVDLINTGQARILTVEECLERPDIKI